MIQVEHLGSVQPRVKVFVRKKCTVPSGVGTVDSAKIETLQLISKRPVEPRTPWGNSGHCYSGLMSVYRPILGPN